MGNELNEIFDGHFPIKCGTLFDSDAISLGETDYNQYLKLQIDRQTPLQ